MPVATDLLVMANFKPFLDILKVFNSANFKVDRFKCFLAICRASCLTTFLTMQSCISGLVIWKWVESSSGFNSYAISTGIVHFQMFCSNVSMILNNSKIADTLNSIQYAIDSRKINCHNFPNDNCP